MIAFPSRPAVGYVRVSTEEQARGGVSLEAQEARIRGYCTGQDLELADVLIDAGVSGKSLERPQLGALLARAIAGQVGTVVIYKLDRLTRRTRDLLAVVEDVFRPHRVELVSLSEQIDTRTPAGVLMLTMLGALAQMEREQISELTREAMRYIREQGRRLGPTPLGFTTPAPGAAMVSAEGELGAVVYILRRRRYGHASYRTIAAELQEGGYQTKRGKRWHPATVRDVWKRRAAYSHFLEAGQSTPA